MHPYLILIVVATSILITCVARKVPFSNGRVNVGPAVPVTEGELRANEQQYHEEMQSHRFLFIVGAHHSGLDEEGIGFSQGLQLIRGSFFDYFSI